MQTQPATTRATAKPKAPRRVHVLTWGGGDEPESPAIYLHATKAGAMRQAGKCMDEVSDNFERGERGRRLRELSTALYTYGLGNETWLSLDVLPIGD